MSRPVGSAALAAAGSAAGHARTLRAILSSLRTRSPPATGVARHGLARHGRCTAAQYSAKASLRA
eukprot:13459412-Alexandrium_andersonii.AAC.1